MKYILLVLLLAITPLSTAFGYENYNIESDYVLNSNPTVCYLEFQHVQEYENIVKQSITDWQSELENYTNNYGSWNIDYKFILDEFENDYSKLGSLDCDIFVTFYEVLDEEFDGTTAIMDSTGQTLIEIYNISELSNAELISVVSHELGHSFGLGHYTTDQNELLEKWYDGIDIPSIMIKDSPSIDNEKITQLDLEKMVSIYGIDGFAESEPLLPAWIQNIFKWYGEGTIQDQELVNAIQYLVQSGIIQII